MAKKNPIEKKAKVIKKYLNLFYMTPQTICAKDIAQILKEKENLQVELWETMNVLEVGLSSENSIDFEPMKPDFNDPSDKAFLKNRNIQTIFAITACEDDIEEMKVCFELIVEKLEGFLCTDSDDFRPFYVAGV